MFDVGSNQPRLNNFNVVQIVAYNTGFTAS